MGGRCTTGGLGSFNRRDGFMPKHDSNDIQHANCHHRSLEGYNIHRRHALIGLTPAGHNVVSARLDSQRRGRRPLWNLWVTASMGRQTMDIELGRVEVGERMTVGLGIAEDGTESEDAFGMPKLFYLNLPCIWTSELKEWYIVVSWCACSELQRSFRGTECCSSEMLSFTCTTNSWKKIKFSFEKDVDHYSGSVD